MQRLCANPLQRHSIAFVNFVTPNRSGPAIGFSYLYEQLTERGMKIDLIDFQLNDRKIDDPDFVGVSIMNFQPVEFNFRIDYIKNRWPKAKIVVGGLGVHPTIVKSGYFEKTYPDLMFVEGDGLLPLYNLLTGGITFSNIYLSTYPLMSRPVEFSMYSDYALRHRFEHVFLVSGVGCSFCCLFCPSRKSFRYTARPVEVVKKEIANLKKRGIDTFDFGDMSFFYNPNWKEIADYVKSQDMYFGFIIDLRKQDMLDQLRYSADRNMFYCIYGVETFNQQSLKAVGKGTNAEIMKSFFKGLPALRKEYPHPFFHSAFLIGGLPYQTMDDIKRDTEIIEKAGIEHYFLTMYTRPFVLELDDTSMGARHGVYVDPETGVVTHTDWISKKDMQKLTEESDRNWDVMDKMFRKWHSFKPPLKKWQINLK